MTNSQKNRTTDYRRIVAKCGTNLLTAGSDQLDMQVMAALVGQFARLHKQGLDVVIVTSGAIAAGRHRLGLSGDRREMPLRQVLAAVGQSHLMQAYDELFTWHDITVAQTLLTRRDLSDRQGYLNARNTLLNLLDLRVVPIVNENDVVAIEEIAGANIGDNDNLSALVANLVDADLLVLLSDVDGLYNADPRADPAALLISHVDRIDEEIERYAGGAGSGRGVGGMVTKVQAARLATAGGADVVIANGHTTDVVSRIIQGDPVGTLFPAAVDKLESRKRWMRTGLSLKGSLVVDVGAAEALANTSCSLLPAGIMEVRGSFDRGDAIEILIDKTSQTLAYGIANYSSVDLAAIRGIRSDRIEEKLGYQYGGEAVHRDNLVLL
ncbi:MAG TPA: glutamate 5-kinase [Dehalococcoidia bacterium]|nr:glutamate 5-kinase [Dehalococcoidia bacterium]